jgi:hypothetical protein
MKVPEGVFAVADLAREHGIDPKTARARLRKHFGTTLAELGKDHWTFGPEDKTAVLSIIRGT